MPEALVFGATFILVMMVLFGAFTIIMLRLLNKEFEADEKWDGRP